MSSSRRLLDMVEGCHTKGVLIQYISVLQMRFLSLHLRNQQ